MVHCYDCGQSMPDEQIVRRFVRTGVSSGRRSYRSYYHKVSLCPACAASRAKSNWIFLIVFLAIGGPVLTLCICGGIFGAIAQKAAKRVEPANSESAPQPYRLAAKVTWTGPPGTRKIGLQHGGIPGSITAGDHSFSLAPDMTWPNVSVGQNVECVMEWRNGQWVVSQVNPTQSFVQADKQPFDVILINSFLGITSDFKVYAKLVAGGLKIVDLDTGKNLVSPKWDRDWGVPLSVTFGHESFAVVTSPEAYADKAVKIFSRKTGELEQNIHGRQIDINRATFAVGGRLLAMTEFRRGKGYFLVLRDVPEKKTVAEVNLVGTGYCCLALAEKNVAAYESNSGRITVVETATGMLVKEINSGNFRKRQRFGEGRMPFAISPAGNLIACEAEDAVVLYDISGEKIAHKLEGHLETVRAVGFSPSGEIVASAAKDKTIRFWSVKEGKEIQIIKNLRASPTELIFSTAGNRIVAVYPELRKAEIRSVALK